MGLKGDLDEVAKVWRVTPWRIRAWLVLSLFLASGSIASLSETVSKWKGFILDSVRFYRRWISTPLLEFLGALVPFPLPAGTAEVFILLGLLVSANLRIALYGGGASYTRGWAAGISSGAVLLVLAVLAIERSEATIAYLVGAIVASAAMCSYNYIKVGGATRVLWLVYLLGPFALVGIAGAVNSGLSK